MTHKMENQIVIDLCRVRGLNEVLGVFRSYGLPVPKDVTFQTLK